MSQPRQQEPRRRREAPGVDAVLTAGVVEGEERLAALDASSGGAFVLTTHRLVYTGGADEPAVFASSRLEDISAIEVTRRPRDRRALIWAGAGAVAAVAVWQIAADTPVGPAAGVVVGLVSLGLVADYLVRPFGFSLRFHTRGVAIASTVPSKRLPAARAFMARLEAAREARKVGALAELVKRGAPVSGLAVAPWWGGDPEGLVRNGAASAGAAALVTAVTAVSDQVMQQTVVTTAPEAPVQGEALTTGTAAAGEPAPAAAPQATSGPPALQENDAPPADGKHEDALDESRGGPELRPAG